MLQSVDTPLPHAARQRWMRLLARAPLPLLEKTVGEHALAPVTWLRPPETGLFMVQGRAGGTGERFNVGEITVTRCALRLPRAASVMGVAYVMGRSHRHAQLAAIADALLQAPEERARLEEALLAPIAHSLDQAKERVQQQAQSTRVNFFAIARESGGADLETEQEQ
jgi:alpha-D-ribose 1-methylphosphonate 5-triphosphate synthase subunit PhnG